MLLNDPTYVEAARALAGRILTEGGKDQAAGIRFGFRLVTARKPDATGHSHIWPDRAADSN